MPRIISGHFCFDGLERVGYAAEVMGKRKAWEGGSSGEKRLRRVDRRQCAWKMIDVDGAVGEGHKARVIVELVSRFDLSGFEEPIRSREHGPGRSALDPALLLSLWIYGISEGIGRSRELARRMEYEPALLWILGDREGVCHSKLSEFRAAHGEALREMFADCLVLLEGEGLVDLKRVMQDGTKIQAQAGGDSFRRMGTIEEKLEQARAVVVRLEKQAAEEEAEEGGSLRQRSARQRAARERVERLEAARAEIVKVREGAKEEEREKARVSVSEAEARRMKHGNDGGISPSYNVQISTDAKAGAIVGVELTQEAGDAHQLVPAVERMEEVFERKPDQVVADGGYTTRANIQEMKGYAVDFIGSLGDQEKRQKAALKTSGIAIEFGPAAFVRIGQGRGQLRCPAGQALEYVRQSRKRELVYYQYQARAEDCGNCRHRRQCCSKQSPQRRTVSILQERAEVIEFRQKMETEAARAAYRQRGCVAEFPNAWIKEKIGLRKFRLRGIVKAGLEAVWACLTYNILLWGRLRGGMKAAAA